MLFTCFFLLFSSENFQTTKSLTANNSSYITQSQDNNLEDLAQLENWMEMSKKDTRRTLLKFHNDRIQTLQRSLDNEEKAKKNLQKLFKTEEVFFLKSASKKRKIGEIESLEDYRSKKQALDSWKENYLQKKLSLDAALKDLKHKEIIRPEYEVENLDTISCGYFEKFDTDCSNLCNILQEMKNISDLILNGKRSEIPGFSNIILSINNSNLREISIFKTNISKEDWVVLKDKLINCNQLCKLALYCMNIDSEALPFIIEILENNLNLLTLDLNDNDLKTEDLRKILPILEKMKKLRSINLMHNKFDQEGFELLKKFNKDTNKKRKKEINIVLC